MFLKLTRWDGEAFYIEHTRVESFCLGTDRDPDTGDPLTILITKSANRVDIKDTPEELLVRLNEQEAKEIEKVNRFEKILNE